MGLPQIDAYRFISKIYRTTCTINACPYYEPCRPPGTYIPVKFGTEQNMKWAATLKQLIFSGSYIVGLQSSQKLQTKFLKNA